MFSHLLSVSPLTGERSAALYHLVIFRFYYVIFQSPY